MRGIVESGTGGVGRHFTENPTALKARSDAAGCQLYPGTFNVRPVGTTPAEFTAQLGPCDFETDRDNERLGPLQWWAVVVSSDAVRDVPAFVVRHPKTGNSRTVEIMATAKLRDFLDVHDGDLVELDRTAPRLDPGVPVQS